MTLITSYTAKGAEVVAKKTEKIAEEDIVVRNELGQMVVVVPKGQPIPEDFDEETYASRSVPIRQADEAEGEADDKPAKRSAKKGDAAPENKRAED
jgi:hypothetical protein